MNLSEIKQMVAEIKRSLGDAMLGKVEFAATKTDKAVLVHDGDALDVGTNVYVEDEEGNRTPAEEGIYTLEDGSRVKVAEGKVAEVLDPEEETETKEETPAVSTEMAAQTPDSVTREEFAALSNTVSEMASVIERFTATMETAHESFATRLAAMERTPAGETPEKEYKREEKVINTGDATLDRKLANIRAFRK